MTTIDRKHIYFAIVVLSLAFGLVNEVNSLFLWSILSVAMSVFAVQLLDTKYSVLIALVFVSFQGFFKIISNYHPIVHLGADIIVITLLFKIIVMKFFNKVQDEDLYPPLYALFFIHFGWVAICLFNPYSVGLMPGIAGAKVYVSMFLLYFFGYYVTRSLKDVHLFFRVFIVLAGIHAIAGFIQGFLGPASVVWLHPRYSVAMAKYADTAFRPFGLTHHPGAPSVYIYPALAFFMYFILLGRSKLEKILLLLSLPIIGQTLLFCQVRSSIIKGLVSMFGFVILFFTSRYRMNPQKKIYAFMLISAGVLITLFTVPKIMAISVDSLESNQAAFERSLTAFDIEKMSHARRNTMQRFLMYAKRVPFGAGLSRVGASAGAFKTANAGDKFFPPGYFFADNLFITTVIELGIPGLIFLTLLITLILLSGFTYWASEDRQPLIGAQLAILSALFAIFIGSYGAEGIIYNPESAFFWFFAGVLIKLGQKDFKVDPLIDKA